MKKFKNDHVPEVIESVELIPRNQLRWKTAPSLRPGIAMMEAAAAGQPEAVAVRDAWAFSHPVTVMDRAAFAELIERNSGEVFIVEQA